MKRKTELQWSGTAWLSTMYKKTRFKQATHQRPFPPFWNAPGRHAQLLTPALLLTFFPMPTVNSRPLRQWVRDGGWHFTFQRSSLALGWAGGIFQALATTPVQRPLHQRHRDLAAWPWRLSRSDSWMLWSSCYFLAQRRENTLTEKKRGRRKLYSLKRSQLTHDTPSP